MDKDKWIQGKKTSSFPQLFLIWAIIVAVFVMSAISIANRGA